MAQLVLVDAKVLINAVDLSDHVKSISVEYDAAAVDVTAMGPGGIKANLGGLKDINITIDFYQDYAAGKVDITLFPLVGTVIPVEFTPVKSTAVSTTNPRYTTSLLLTKYPPLGGAVGEAAMAQITLVSAGVVLTRNLT